jgi:hypothetical protein
MLPRKRLRLLTASKPDAIIPVGPVEQYARIARVLSDHPHLADVMVEVAELSVIAEEQHLTGRVQVNFQTGKPKSVSMKGG